VYHTPPSTAGATSCGWAPGGTSYSWNETISTIGVAGLGVAVSPGVSAGDGVLVVVSVGGAGVFVAVGVGVVVSVAVAVGVVERATAVSVGLTVAVAVEEADAGMGSLSQPNPTMDVIAQRANTSAACRTDTNLIRRRYAWSKVADLSYAPDPSPPG
jgi:hypothetical protein